MGLKLSHITPLLAAGAVAAAIASAPIAAAAPTGQSGTGTGQSGTGTTSATVRQSPGNVEINNAPPRVTFHPYGDMPFLLGGHGALRGTL